MNDSEVADFIAKNIMGWWLYDAGDYPLDCWLNSSDEVVCDRNEYNPCHNIVQAVEAAETWRKKDGLWRRWSLVSPVLTEGDAIGVFGARFIDYTREYYGVKCNAPAAICYGLVAAVKGK